MRDRLTGLYNRFGLEQSGVPFFQKLREERKPVAFLFADIDDMKSINDNHGHETGDTASSTLPSRSVISPPEEAKTLKECIQMADARMYTVKKSRHIARGQ